MRESNIKIYKETLAYIKHIKITPSIKFKINDIIINNIKPKEKCQIIVQNLDTIEMVYNFKKENLNPVFLNMCSDKTSGGGVLSGASSQEEDIFRKSDANNCLLNIEYPLNVENILYSPKVTIFRDLKNKLINPYNASMISCPAIKNPNLIKNKYNKDDYKLMYSKIEAIFRLAILYKHDSIILGAFGCGAYNNPVNEVVNIFKDLINKYSTYFKKIGFAILIVDLVRDKKNYDIFNQYLM